MKTLREFAISTLQLSKYPMGEVLPMLELFTVIIAPSLVHLTRQESESVNTIHSFHELCEHWHSGGY